MRAIVTVGQGGPEVLRVDELPDPVPGPTDVLIEVVAAGVNRADLLQRRGFYPPPAGASEVLGLECSGRIAALGSEVAGWSVGDEVCALLTGGGYASLVSVPVGQVMPVPEGVDLVSAAALPEAAATVYSNLAMTAGLRAGEWVLVHGGCSGIGTFATQWARAIGAHVAVTTGGAAKQIICRDLGADLAVDYLEQDFVSEVREATGSRGADVILDIMGAKYLGANVSTLAVGGRLVVIGLQGGISAELNLGQLLMSRATIAATSLRARPAVEKDEICRRVVADVWPLVADGSITPVIDEVVPFEEAGRAQLRLDDGAHVGKVLLAIGE